MSSDEGEDEAVRALLREEAEWAKRRAEPQPEPEPQPVPVSRTGLSDGVVALGCADDGAPGPKRSKSASDSK